MTQLQIVNFSDESFRSELDRAYPYCSDRLHHYRIRCFTSWAGGGDLGLLEIVIEAENQGLRIEVQGSRIPVMPGILSGR